jgi:hypothetical protein
MADLTLRLTKGSALTLSELDSNFQALDSDVSNLSSSLASSYVTLNTTQTISGAKTFSNTLTASNGAILNGLTYPTTDGAINQFITTNGSGTLSFATVESYDSVKVQGQIDSDFTTTRTTDALSEGATNLYYTNARARTEITGSDLDMGGNKVLFGNLYSTFGDLPDASTYHGMFAHVHATGKGYFAHAGNWVPLIDDNNVDSSIDARVTQSFVNNLGFIVSDASDNYTSGTLTFNSGTTLTAASGATVNFSNTTGTAPFTVASTTKVTNLNVDAVDGFNGIGIYDSAGTLLNGA